LAKKTPAGIEEMKNRIAAPTGLAVETPEIPRVKSDVRKANIPVDVAKPTNSSFLLFYENR